TCRSITICAISWVLVFFPGVPRINRWSLDLVQSLSTILWLMLMLKPIGFGLFCLLYIFLFPFLLVFIMT
ncbi:hypothetical protein ACH5RR_040837, partial [Cinchona calisaya]